MVEDFSMIVKYWGVRGSIPSPLTSEQIRDKETALIQQIIKDGGTEKLFGKTPTVDTVQKYLQNLPFSFSNTYGGDTTCVEIQAKNSPLIIIDAGTGIRLLGKTVIGRLFGGKHLNPLCQDENSKKDIYIFFTHYHWDHIQGFPFFAPAFIGGNYRLNFHFYGKRDARILLSEVLKGQQQYPNFPVVWDDVPCSKEYIELSRLNGTTLKLGDVSVTYQELTHPDSVFAYRFEVAGKSFVFATDNEHKDTPDPRLQRLAKNADFLYYDSQYTPDEYKGKPGCLTGAMPKFDWGHSTYEWGIRNALEANVKALVFGHHEPLRDDFKMDELKEQAYNFLAEEKKRPEYAGKNLEIMVAYQGLEHRL